jgi:hypothetical protein
VTPTSTSTTEPTLPESIRVLFRETVTPSPEAAISPIQLDTRLGSFNQAIDPRDRFELPLERLYGAFTYNNLQDGVRWTALWYRSEEVVCVETKPWDGGTGGYGYTECEPDAWLPGSYRIDMFLGDRWVVSTRFSVVGGLEGTTTPSPTGP